MSKYTKSQLKEMAKVTLKARENRDPRFEMLLITMSMATGLDSGDVIKKIQRLSEG